METARLPPHLVIEEFEGRGVMTEGPPGRSQEGYQFRFRVQAQAGQPEVWTPWMYLPAAGLEDLQLRLQELMLSGHLARPGDNGSSVQ